MILRFRPLLIALAATLPALAQAQSVDDFSLEPAPTPSASPQAQGPADTRSGVEIRPRAVNTPTPTPTPAPRLAIEPPTAVPSPTAEPAQAPPRRGSAPTISRPAPDPQSRPSPIERAPLEPQDMSEPEAGTEGGPDAGVVLPPRDTPAPSIATSAAAEAAATDGTVPWAWIGAIVALLLASGIGLAAWRRRREGQVAEIDRPSTTLAAPREAIRMNQAVQLRVENEKLIRSAVYATLKYRITLINRTDTALADVSLGVDLVSAHAGLPMEQQVATDATALETRHRVARLGPRQSTSLEGQVQLPLAQAQVVMQGRHPLLVPLLRVRVDGPGGGALVKTFVVGQGLPDGGRVQPFRLDEPPRSYAPIAQRELA